MSKDTLAFLLIFQNNALLFLDGNVDEEYE